MDKAPPTTGTMLRAHKVTKATLRSTFQRLRSLKLLRQERSKMEATSGNSDNPLLSTQKSDSGLHVALHPLVLLTISDYITRHTLRNLKGPVVGALLGQQNGQELTVEHAFECKVDKDMIDWEWFDTRLQQSKKSFWHRSKRLQLTDVVL